MSIFLSLPAGPAFTLDRLHRAGHGAFVVGGCVRDSLAGLVPHDWDICTSAPPQEICRVFADIPQALPGIEYGTVTLLLESGPCEVTTFRVEQGYSDGRRPDGVSFTSRLEEDLARRDFTVNAMAWNPWQGLQDPFGGQKDLAAGRLRCVGQPEVRFAEDGLRLLRGLRFYSCRGLVPDEDQGVIFAGVQLPEGASRPRTEAVVKPMVQEVMALPGVDSVMDIYGHNILGGEGENVASLIIPLDPWGQRKAPDQQLSALVAKVNAIAAKYPQAQINVVTPPPIQGLGMATGIDMRLESTVDNDPVRLAEVMGIVLRELNQAPEVNYAFCSFTADTPHLFVDIDRQKAELLEVPVSTIFSTLQTYFGSAYINDINIGTQVNRVMLQSEWNYRNSIDRIGEIFVRSSTGEQVPIQSVATVKKTLAPRSLDRYNLYPTAAITIVMKQGYSTGEGIARVHEIGERVLPDGYTYEWSGMTYQEEHAQGGITMVLVIALIFAFLFLVAQYESWSTPVSVILSLPTAMLGALVGFRIMGIPLSVYGQLGILLLVGLASKNAILIVEFAKEQRELHGLPLIQAAAVAATERFRAVLMTAFTCVLGAAPMLVASGAGAASRKAVGSTLFFGMMAATCIGIFLIPGLWVAFQGLREKVKSRIGRNKNAEAQAN